MVEIIGKLVTTDTAALAANGVVTHDTTLNDMRRPGLLKRLRVSGHVTWPNLGDAAMLVLGYADATVAQIVTALTTAVVNPESAATYRRNQLDERVLVDFVALGPMGQAAAEAVAFNWEPELPKKGLPFSIGDGFNTYVFNTNAANAFTNGPTLRLVHRWMFAWLG